jgi:hypothetical protein
MLKEMKNRNSADGQSHSDSKSGCRASVPTIDPEPFDTCVHLLDVRGQLGQGLTVGQDGAGGTAQEGVVPHTEETRQDLTTGQSGEASRRTRATVRTGPGKMLAHRESLQQVSQHRLPLLCDCLIVQSASNRGHTAAEVRVAYRQVFFQWRCVEVLIHRPGTLQEAEVETREAD